MSSNSWVDASFGDGFGNQPPAFTQAYQIGTNWAFLPTQLMAPDSMNAMSHPGSVLLMTAACKTGWPSLGLLLWLLLSWDLPSQTMPSTTGACQASGGGGDNYAPL